MKRCYYEVLGVAKDANDDAIRKAYNALAMKWHPDRNPGDPEAEVHFKAVVEAYSVLRDGEKRKTYDRYGHAGLDAGQAGGFPFGGGEDLMDMLREAFNMFGGRGGGRRGPRAGADLQVAFEITLLESYRGVKKEFKVPRNEACSTCKGSGARPGTQVSSCRRCGGQGALGSFLFQQTCPSCRGRGSIINDPCRDCRGNGQIEAQHEVAVDVPAGIDDGMQIVVRGAGENGEPGAPRGDLYCLVRVKSHQLFARDGQHLHTEVPISFSHAALGAPLDVPTLEGKSATITVPRATQSGDEVRVTGKGMPHVRGGRPGDLVVHLRVETPKNLTARQEELFRELAELEAKSPPPGKKSWLERIAEFFTSAKGDKG
jgi:molecular chaperone DnaJ